MSRPIPRRHALAGMAALGLAGLRSRAVGAAPETPAHPLAERLAGYADRLRYSDLDAATIEAVKSHLIDTLGCAVAAFDEKPVRICREVALAARRRRATVTRTGAPVSPGLAALPNRTAAPYYGFEDG